MSLEYDLCQVEILNWLLAISLYFQGRFVARAVNRGVIRVEITFKAMKLFT